MTTIVFGDSGSVIEQLIMDTGMHDGLDGYHPNDSVVNYDLEDCGNDFGITARSNYDEDFSQLMIWWLFWLGGCDGILLVLGFSMLFCLCCSADQKVKVGDMELTARLPGFILFDLDNCRPK